MKLSTWPAHKRDSQVNRWLPKSYNTPRTPTIHACVPNKNTGIFTAANTACCLFDNLFITQMGKKKDENVSCISKGKRMEDERARKKGRCLKEARLSWWATQSQKTHTGTCCGTTCGFTRGVWCCVGANPRETTDASLTRQWEREEMMLSIAGWFIIISMKNSRHDRGEKKSKVCKWRDNLCSYLAYWPWKACGIKHVRDRERARASRGLGQGCWLHSGKSRCKWKQLWCGCLH